MSDAADTRVFTIQTSNKGGGHAVKVCLVVERTLREDSSLTRVEEVGDKSGAIFLDETNFKVRSGYHVEELGGTRVIVRRGQSTRPVYVKDSLDRWGTDRERKTYAIFPTARDIP